MGDGNITDFQFLAEHSLDVLCRANLERKFMYVSPSSVHVLGWLPAEMIGKAAIEFILEEDRALLAEAVGKDRHTVQLRMRKKDGSSAWMENTAQLVRDPATNEPIEWIVTMRDISERKALEEKLTALAMVDGLTGLTNRRAFDEALNREWSRTLREGSELSLLLLDIDHFKRFNDEFGHQVGDDCLRAVAIAVRENVRSSDMVARYGGEELAVILIGSDMMNATEVAEKVRRAVEALDLKLGLKLENRDDAACRVTVSIGAATALARHGGTMRMPESLLLAADNALYQAKREGRNRTATTLLMASKD